MHNAFVIDGNAERRAEVCRVLLQGQGHAEPFETIEEFLAFAPDEGTALVCDEDGAAARLCTRLQDSPRLVPVIGYGTSPALADVVATMQAGAISYLAWPFTLEAYAAEIQRMAPEVQQIMGRKRRAAHARSLLENLTAREREVLTGLTTHGTNKAIAKALEISPRTVEKYRAAILVRLGVDNTPQAIRVAVEGGALNDDLSGDATSAGSTGDPDVIG